MITDWLTNTVWFLAAGALGAFFYFLDKNQHGVLWSAYATAALVLLAIACHIRSALIAKEVFLESLDFRKVDAYFVDVAPNKYQLGLVAHVFNTDSRALRFDDIHFKGQVPPVLTAASGGFLLQRIQPYDVDHTERRKQYVKPGTESRIYMLTSTLFEMQLAPGGVPELRLSGTWTFTFNKERFPATPHDVTTSGLISLADWNKQASMQ